MGKFECNIQVIVTAHKNIYAIIDDERSELMVDRIVGLNYISRLDRMESVYKLMGIRSDMAGHEKKLTTLLLKILFISAGEYIVSGGNPNIVLCPRGTMPNIDGYRNHSNSQREDLGAYCRPILRMQ